MNEQTNPEVEPKPPVFLPVQRKWLYAGVALTNLDGDGLYDDERSALYVYYADLCLYLRSKLAAEREASGIQAEALAEAQKEIRALKGESPDGWMVVEHWPDAVSGASGDVYAWPEAAHETINERIGYGDEDATAYVVRGIRIIREPQDAAIDAARGAGDGRFTTTVG